MIRSLAIFSSAPLVSGLFVRLALPDIAIHSQARIIVLLSLLFVLTRACVAQIGRDTRATTVQFDGQRVLNKVLALGLGWLAVLGFAALGTRLNILASTVFFEDFIWCTPALPVLLPAYVMLTERTNAVAQDAHASFGAFVRRRGPWIPAEHKTLVLGWLVKAFFLPLMYGALVVTVQEVLELGLLPRFDNWIRWFVLVGLSIDLTVATTGYLSTSKIFGAEIRSVDETWTGWASCLVCYAPFLYYLQIVTAQRDTILWNDWLQPEQPLYWIWATLLVCSWGIYWLSSIAFGLRFSNLTYRGLIDRGPYRYLKHPAYVSKNIYWWLYTVPLVGVHSAGDIAANLGGMSAISLIYYLRAKTEERHLMRYPEYAEYAARIEQRSIRAKLQQWFARSRTAS